MILTMMGTTTSYFAKLYAGAVAFPVAVILPYMDEDIPSGGIWDLAKQVPALAVLVFVVVTFLRHMQTVAETQQETMARMTKAIDGLREKVETQSQLLARLDAQRRDF